MALRLALVASLVVIAAFGPADVAGAGAPADDVADVELRAAPPIDEFDVGRRVVDDLGSQAVLKIRVSGFDSFERAEVMQCIYTATRTCANRLPVQSDDSGRAVLQFLVTDDFTEAAGRAGRCAPDRNRCTLRIESVEGSAFAEIDTVFSGRARPRAQITVSPRDEIDDGSQVRVSVSGYPPGATLDAVLCRGLDSAGPRTCGPPGPTAPVKIAADGTGTAELTLAEGPVGSAETRCSRRTVCGIALVSPSTYVRADVASISFAGRAGPEYDATQLAVGLGIAALLIALAGGWMITGEWDPPREADASTLDNAEYADLDAMVAEQDARELAAGVSPDGG